MSTHMSLRLCSHGTTLDDAEQTAAEDAAREVFARHNVAAEDCHAVHLKIADSADDSIDSVTQERAVIWAVAENAAILAATKGWARCPDDLSLGPA